MKGVGERNKEENVFRDRLEGWSLDGRRIVLNEDEIDCLEDFFTVGGNELLFVLLVLEINAKVIQKSLEFMIYLLLTVKKKKKKRKLNFLWVLILY